MKRNWDIVRTILEHAESDDLLNFAQSGAYLSECGISEEDFLRHIELLFDAEILKGGTIHRQQDGKPFFSRLSATFLTMQGHDLLDAMRDKTVWNRIKAKALKQNCSVSWAFIKAALPVAYQELVKELP